MTRMMRLLAGIFCVGVFGLARIVVADDAVQQGSIHLEMIYQQQAIAGGDAFVYQIARATTTAEGQNYAFLPAFQKASTVVNLADLDSNNRTYAQSLLTYRHQATPVFYVDHLPSGGVSITGLDEGVYLVVQEKAADGYEPFSPFLVTIPKDGQYTVEAFEKMSPIVTKVPTVIPDSPTKRATELPFTGQLWWPAPLMLVLGLTCWGLSFWTRRSHK